jgi:hypothetical protein
MKGYSLSFSGNGDTTFENSNFMVTVDNHNERSKVLHIHGLSNTPFLANISSTYLSDQNGRISENVTFDGNSPKLTNLKIDRSTHPLNVFVNIQQGGIFQGRLILETANVTYSIPIVVTTKPLCFSLRSDFHLQPIHMCLARTGTAASNTMIEVNKE